MSAPKGSAALVFLLFLSPEKGLSVSPSHWPSAEPAGPWAVLSAEQ